MELQKMTNAWTVNGGSIIGEATGTGLLSIQVSWESTGSGLITVVETDTTGCSGAVELEVDLLINHVPEWELMGFQVYPNPASESINVSQGSSNAPLAFLELVSVGGKVVASWPMNGFTTQLELSGFAEGMYT